MVQRIVADSLINFVSFAFLNHFQNFFTDSQHTVVYLIDSVGHLEVLNFFLRILRNTLETMPLSKVTLWNFLSLKEHPDWFVDLILFDWLLNCVQYKIEILVVVSLYEMDSVGWIDSTVTSAFFWKCTHLIMDKIVVEVIYSVFPFVLHWVISQLLDKKCMRKTSLNLKLLECGHANLRLIHEASWSRCKDLLLVSHCTRLTA